MTHDGRNDISHAGTWVQDTIGRVIREQPLVVAAIGLAAGALTAALLPRTELEEETIGEYGEALYKTAAQAGATLKDAAFAAGDRLKESAQEHGLSADGFKEMGRDAAETFATTAGLQPDRTGGD